MCCSTTKRIVRFIPTVAEAGREGGREGGRGKHAGYARRV
jgi:hypothetical protein